MIFLVILFFTCAVLLKTASNVRLFVIPAGLKWESRRRSCESRNPLPFPLDSPIKSGNDRLTTNLPAGRQVGHYYYSYQQFDECDNFIYDSC